MNTDDVNAETFTKAIYEEFSSSKRPLTVGDAAEILGLMAAQHEANLAMFELIMSACPDAAGTKERSRATDALMFTGRTFLRAVTHLVALENSPESGNE